MARAWMPMYWGDYLRDTADLSLIEHGAYVKLLSTYYSTGKPLPANAKQLLRICSAFDEAEQAAMHLVLDRFFIKDGAVYRNKRADAEIEKAIQVSEKRAEAGALGAQAKAQANARANADANADTATTTTTTTNTDTPKGRRACALPPGFAPKDSHRELAKTVGIDLEAEFEQFRDHHLARGSTMKDWDRALNTWIRNGVKFGGKRKPKPATDKTYTGTPEDEITWLNH